jgi:hypothetical protein
VTNARSLDAFHLSLPPINELIHRIRTWKPMKASDRADKDEKAAITSYPGVLLGKICTKDDVDIVDLKVNVVMGLAQ